MALTVPTRAPSMPATAPTAPRGVPSPDPMWLHDSPAHPMPDAWRPSVARPPVLLAPPKLVAKIGEAVAAGLAGLRDRLASGDPAEVARALDAVARLENLGLEVQQMARVMGHDGTQAAESVDLPEALSRALAQWSSAAAASNFTLSQPDAASVKVRVDPALLEQLLDLAIELAFESGDALAVRVRTQPASRQAVLLIDVQRTDTIAAGIGRPPADAGAEADDGAEHVRWLMLSQVARAGGIAARREVSGSMLSLVLTLPMATFGAWYDGAARADQAMGSSV